MDKSMAPEATKNEAFVTLLRQHRISKGLTQTKVAKKLGLKTSSTVSFWESGESIPSPAMVPKLARLLGMTALKLTKILDGQDETAASK